MSHGKRPGRVIPTTTDAFTFTVQVQWLNGARAVISTSPLRTYADDTAGTWTKPTITRRAPAGAVRARVQMVASSLNGSIYVDHFELRQP